MKSGKQPVETLEDLKNVVWFGRGSDNKIRHTQWMDIQFYAVWVKSLSEAFEIAGNPKQYRLMKQGSDIGDVPSDEISHLFPVSGHLNSQLLRDAILGRACGSGPLHPVNVREGIAVHYINNRKAALVEWGKAVAKTMVATIEFWSFQELAAYVLGDQKEYPSDIRHVFCRENSIEMLAAPELGWRLKIADQPLEITVDWKDVFTQYRSQQQNVPTLVKHQINARVREMLVEGK